MLEKPIAVVGSSGQLAEALQRVGNERGLNVVARGRPAVDLEDINSVAQFFAEVQPAIVVNAAAYTAVDQAESQPEAAFVLNAEGPAKMAALCAAAGLPLIHISTDYVFDGLKGAAYSEVDPVGPVNAYGASKAAGEMAIRVALPRHIILRTSWLYGVAGGNFVKTMLKLGKARDELSVVNDQIGCPTFADDLAEAVFQIAERSAKDPDGFGWGTYHVCGDGQTSWHGFAEAIFERAASAGLKVPKLTAIPTSEYPTPARRPASTVLDTSKIRAGLGYQPRSWEAALDAALPCIISQLKASSPA